MDSTIKFDGLANLYEDGRPEYPTILIEKLYTDYGFKSTSIIADIGAGTGKFSKLLLGQGSKVFCVEPNKIRTVPARTFENNSFFFTSVAAS